VFDVEIVNEIVNEIDNMGNNKLLPAGPHSPMGMSREKADKISRQIRSISFKMAIRG